MKSPLSACSRPTRARLYPAFCAGVALALAGCGGGGGGSSASPHSSPPTSPPTATTSQSLVIPAPGPGTYAVTEIVPLPGDDETDASGVNSSGQVLGSSSHGEGPNCPAGGACPANVTLVSHLYFFDGTTIAPLNSPLNLVSALNDSGTIAGSALTGSGSSQTGIAGLSTGATLTLCGLLTGDNASGALGVNNHGQAAVTSFNSVTGAAHAALYQNGTLTALPTFTPGESSRASAINSSGQIVGDCVINAAAQASHAVLWSDGQVTDLGTLPGAQLSFANAINDGGQIVGSDGTDGQNQHAFLYANGAMTDLGTLPGGKISGANSINQAGTIAGQSELAFGTAGATASHAVLWRGGQIVDLNTLIAQNAGAVLTNATGINNAGQVCGDGTYKGQRCAFLLTPH